MLFIIYFTEQSAVKMPSLINYVLSMRQIAYFSGILHVITLLPLNRLSPSISQIKELTLTVLYKNMFALKAYLIFEIVIQVFTLGVYSVPSK